MIPNLGLWEVGLEQRRIEKNVISLKQHVHLIYNNIQDEVSDYIHITAYTPAAMEDISRGRWMVDMCVSTQYLGESDGMPPFLHQALRCIMKLFLVQTSAILSVAIIVLHSWLIKRPPWWTSHLHCNYVYANHRQSLWWEQAVAGILNRMGWGSFIQIKCIFTLVRYLRIDIK